MDIGSNPIQLSTNYKKGTNRMKFDLYDRVKIWVDTDDSGWATDLFDVEPQLNWFDVQYYPEQINAIIIWNQGLLLAQYYYYKYLPDKTKMEHRGRVYDISKNGINKRIEQIRNQLEFYNMSEEQFFEGSEEETPSLNCFYDIELITEGEPK